MKDRNPCPPFCTMHQDGDHIGDLVARDGPDGEEQPEVDGWNVYARPRQNAAGEQHVEVVAMPPDGDALRVVVPTIDGSDHTVGGDQ